MVIGGACMLLRGIFKLLEHIRLRQTSLLFRPIFFSVPCMVCLWVLHGVRCPAFCKEGLSRKLVRTQVLRKQTLRVLQLNRSNQRDCPTIAGCDCPSRTLVLRSICMKTRPWPYGHTPLPPSLPPPLSLAPAQVAGISLACARKAHRIGVEPGSGWSWM